MTSPVHAPLTNQELLDAAVALVAHGFKILPIHAINSVGRCACLDPQCQSPGKHPTIPHGSRGASDSLQTITSWWSTWYPGANIGVATGGELVVIDIDISKGGVGSLRKLETVFGKLPETLSVETGSGGRHYYFSSPEQIKNSAGKFGPGFDVRGEGGYVVAPPSLHSSGQRYSWIAGLPETLTELPEVWRALLTGRENGVLLGDDAVFVISDSGATIPEQITAGQRNTLLMAVAGKMRRLGFNQDEIDSALETCNQKRCQPPLSAKEVHRIAHSVTRYAPGAQLSDLLKDDDVFRVDPSDAQQPDTSEQIDSDVPPEIKDDQTEEPDIFDLKPKKGLSGVGTLDGLDHTVTDSGPALLWYTWPGEVIQLNAIPDAGKSTFALNLCLAMASGRSFAPLYKGESPKRILYLDFENRLFRFQRDLEKMREILTASEDRLVRENFHYGVDVELDGKVFMITDNDCLRSLWHYLKNNKIDFLVIDTTAQAALIFNENDNAEMQRKIVGPMKRLGARSGTAIMLIHHEGKSKQEIGLYRGRGASSLAGGSRMILSLQPQEGSERLKILTCEKVKGTKFAPTVFDLNNDLRWFIETGRTAPAQYSQTPPQRIIELLEQNPDGLKLSEISIAIDDISRRALSDYIKKMTDSGVLVKTATTKGGAKYGLAEEDKNPLNDSDLPF